MELLRGTKRLLLTAWVGSLWAVGYLAVPVLFTGLDSKTAGALAGEMFTLVSYVGLVCGVLLAALRVADTRRLADWKLGVLLGMLVLVIIGQLVLQPMMADLKALGLEDGGRMAAFGRLHGVASILYLIESLGGALLVVVGLDEARVAGRKAGCSHFTSAG